ncbi:MAG: hypothetical protein ACKVVT_00535 [Dehalococcoidia bacterium]
MQRHPTRQELLSSAIRTVEEILAPELRTAWAKASAGQLVGLLKYALADTGDASLARQDAELRSVLLRLLAEHPGLAAIAGVDPALAGSDGLREAAGRLLSHAQTASGPAVDAVGTGLRPVALRQIDEDLAEAGPLLQGFMTRVRGGDVE